MSCLLQSKKLSRDNGIEMRINKEAVAWMKIRCAQLLFVVSFLQYMCWERGYDKDKLRKVIGSWKKHNGGRYIGDVPQAIPHTGHRNKEHIA